MVVRISVWMSQVKYTCGTRDRAWDDRGGYFPMSNSNIVRKEHCAEIKTQQNGV